jgi:hypothetical protein
MKSINFSKADYTSITCSKILNIPYYLICTTKFVDSLILIYKDYFMGQFEFVVGE